MRLVRPLLLLCALVLLGCGASAANVVVGAHQVVASATLALNTLERGLEGTHKRALRACLYDAAGAALRTPVAEQEACVNRVEAASRGAIDAYEEAYQVIVAAQAVVATAEAAVQLEQAPNVAELLSVAAQVLGAVQKLRVATEGVRRATLPPALPPPAAPRPTPAPRAPEPPPAGAPPTRPQARLDQLRRST